MSFFAVLNPRQDNDRDEFVVHQCHINLWSLGALKPRRRVLYLDIGLKLQAKKADLKELQIALPADVSHYLDLSDEITSNQKIAELIFDSSVTITRGTAEATTLRIGGDDAMQVLGVVPNNKKIDQLSEKGFSVWPIELAETLRKGDTGYVRVRFHVTDLRPTLSWQKAGWRRTGAILDFRLNDQRSTATLTAGHTLRRRVVDLENVYFFSMMPSILHARTVNPQLNYTRVLESEAWAAYLHRRPERSGKAVLVASWKAKSKAMPPYGRRKLTIREPAVTLEKPLRIYVDYVQTPVKHPIVIAAITAVLLLILAGAVYDLPLQAWSQAVVDHISDGLGTLVAVLVGIGVLGWVSLILRNVRFLKYPGRFIIFVHRLVDRQMYSPTTRDD